MAATSRIKYRFPANKFRNAIRGVYEMAATPDEQRLAFGFNEVVTTTTANIDGEGVAFDPSARVTRTTPTPIVVPCGIEYRSTSEEATPFGPLSQPRLAVTLLDVDYEQIKGADWVELDNERYLYAYDEPPVGLFDVGIHTLVFTHEAER